MTAASQPRASFSSRLRIYLDERFPVLPSLLTALLMAGTADAVAQAAAGRAPLIDLRTALSTCFIFCALFVLRVLDEHKDLQEDSVAHPERALQRGVVTLGELDAVAAVATVVLLLAMASAGVAAGAAGLVCLGYILLMRVEFFVPTFLRPRLVLYALTHQVITPLMCVATVVARAGDLHAPGAAPLLQATTAALLGLVFEFGRKVRAPSEEIVGDASYSLAYGPARAAGMVALCGVLAALAALGVCLALGATAAAALPAALGACVVCGAFLDFAREVRAGRGRALLGAVALGALLTYATMGLAAAWGAR